ncbi:MAG: inositol monophosphatase family protein [Candidatus Levybacteria bacterium]|nr:inositol monophosphatase family protein [Candidatus Levybacteria bacterium]
MNKTMLTIFITTAVDAMLEAGNFAILSQKGIKNIGKVSENLENDSKYIKTKRSAKTATDDKVQEILLQAVLKVIKPENVRLDAEEMTKTTQLFTNKDAKLTLVIDPIDGTLEYIEGKNNYSICVALVSKGEIITALVYFPASRELYYIDADGKSYYKSFSRNLKIKKKIKLNIPSKINSFRIYQNNRVNKKITINLRQKNYLIDNDNNNKIIWSKALINCISGNYYVCIFHTPQIRDILLGAIIEHMPGGYATDWKGNKLIWQNGGRVKNAIFGFNNAPKVILNCLR